MKKIRFLGWAILGTFALFFVLKGKAYYTAGLIPFLIAVGAFAIEKYFRPNMVTVGVLTIISIYALLSVPFVKPVFSYPAIEKYGKQTRGWVAAPFMRWEDGNDYPVSQVYADMTGWQEMAELAGKAYNQLSVEEKNNCILFCERNYGYAGAMHFYGKKYKLPQPITYHESYIFWAPYSIPPGPVIYVNYEIGGMSEIFETVEEIGIVSDPYFREKGVKVFLCMNPKTDVPNIYKSDIQRERERFTRQK